MAHPGTLHRYNNRLVAFEHSPTHKPGSTSSSSPTNTLLWIGGLTDGLLTVHYPATIAKALPENWRIAEVLCSSSYKGWATGSLTRDAREIGQCVKYFQGLRGQHGGKVVVMGHSTGCQDIMELCVGSGKGELHLDGAILQGGVSDREAFADIATREGKKEEFDAVVAKAIELVEQGRGNEVLQKEGNAVAEMLGAPMTAYRTVSLLTEGGDDDYFSSDLSDDMLQSTFGAFPRDTPLCFLLGELDPYVLASIDRSQLLQKWTDIVRQGGGVVDDVNGGVVKGAHHNLNDDPGEAVQELVRMVLGFLRGIDNCSKQDREDIQTSKQELKPPSNPVLENWEKLLFLRTPSGHATPLKNKPGIPNVRREVDEDADAYALDGIVRVEPESDAEQQFPSPAPAYAKRKGNSMTYKNKPPRKKTSR